MKMTFSHAWRALRNRNFRLYFLGQSISLIGTWMTRLATSWLVFRLTHSALLLGLVSFSGQFIAFVFGPVAGVWVERLNRRRLLVWTQVAAAVQSLAMAALALAHVITLWEIVGLAALQGLINAFDMPGRQAFLVQMVEDRNDLGNAIAINSSMANTARLIGPAIAGLMIAAVGEGWCFLIDGISYFAVIASLLMMRINVEEVRRRGNGMLGEMREGWHYVRTFVPIRTVLLFFAVLSLLGYPCIVLLPVFAGQVLQGDAHTLGWLSAAGGGGALVSGISLALRKSAVDLAPVIQRAGIILSTALIFFGLSHIFWLSLASMVFIGFGLTQCASASNAMIQSLAADDMRARVMSYYMMAFFGAAPCGSLLAGMLAHQVGPPRAILCTGAGCLVGSLWFGWQLPNLRASVQPIYRTAALAPDHNAIGTSEVRKSVA